MIPIWILIKCINWYAYESISCQYANSWDANSNHVVKMSFNWTVVTGCLNFVISTCGKMRKVCCFGGAGYRSRYLSHAKRALYHLSYAPWLNLFCFHNMFYAYVRRYTTMLIWQNLSNRYLTIFWWMISYKSFTVHKLSTITNFCCRVRATVVFVKSGHAQHFWKFVLIMHSSHSFFYFFCVNSYLQKVNITKIYLWQDIYRNSNQHHSNNKIILSCYEK